MASELYQMKADRCPHCGTITVLYIGGRELSCEKYTAVLRVAL